MEPLSVTASIIAVLQAANAVVSVCYDYSAAVKNSPWELSRIIEEVTSLRNVLEALVQFAKKAETADPVAETKLPTLKLLCESNSKPGPLDNCLEELRCLLGKLNFPKWAGADGSKRRAFIQAISWPLQEGETTKTLDKISRFKATLNLAVTMDQATLTLEIQNMMQAMQSTTSTVQEDMVKMYQSLTSFQTDSQRTKIHQWLSAPDPSSNHNKARHKRQATTGGWFVEGGQFADWKITPDSFLWLYGIPGCGKTILSSTIIENVLNDCRLNPAHAAAYFYFDFKDTGKQQHERMIRSLIVQLSMGFANTPAALQSLYSSCASGQQQPSIHLLLTALQQIIQQFDGTFLIFDALDECKDRPELLETLEKTARLGLGTLHILATSRREKDIEEALSLLVGDQERICIQSAVINKDIRAYIHSRIHSDRVLKRWQRHPAVQQEIEEELMSKVDGMFRWTECQLDALAKCLNLPALHKALASLPKTLDDTFARILCSIDEDYRKLALKIFQWLVYSMRPLQIEEIAEVIAVDPETNPRFDPGRLFPDPEEILAICPSLITTVVSPNRWGNPTSTKIKLAHFSVQEYLVSERVHDTWYSIREMNAHTSIAEICVAYLSQFDSPVDAWDKVFKYALHFYASNYWAKHARKIDIYRETPPIIEDFVLAQNDGFIDWALSHTCTLDESRPLGFTHLSLYLMSACGLSRLVKSILDKGANVNFQVENYGTALYGASRNGQEAVVKLLLDNGANVNLRLEGRGTPLYVALKNGHEEVVKLLLENGADVNAPLKASTALEGVSLNVQEAVVKILLENGADVNAPLGAFRTALYKAAMNDQEAVVKILLENVNIRLENYGTAQGGASMNGHEAVVKLLLDKGADVNAGPEGHGTALYIASRHGQEAVVELLLKHGADVNAQPERHGTVVVLRSGRKAVVKLLLKNGAEVNTELKDFGSALNGASKNGDEAVMKLLLENNTHFSTPNDNKTSFSTTIEQVRGLMVPFLLKNIL